MCEGIISKNIKNRGKRHTKKFKLGQTPKPPKYFTSGMYSMIAIRNHISLESKIALKFNFKFCAKLFLDQKYQIRNHFEENI